jgi:hypothetical protein
MSRIHPFIVVDKTKLIHWSLLVRNHSNRSFVGFLFSTRHFVQSVIKKGTPLGSSLPPLVENDLVASTSQGEMSIVNGNQSQVPMSSSLDHTRLIFNCVLSSVCKVHTPDVRRMKNSLKPYFLRTLCICGHLESGISFHCTSLPCPLWLALPINC